MPDVVIAAMSYHAKRLYLALRGPGPDPKGDQVDGVIPAENVTCETLSAIITDQLAGKYIL